MTDKELAGVLYDALKLAGKWIRNNPPADFPEEDSDIHFRIIAGGIIRDPDGKEYVNYFIDKAIKNKESTS